MAYMAFSLVLLGFNFEEFRIYFPLMAASVSVQMAYFLMGNKQRRIKEFLNYLLIGAVIYSLYGNSIILAY